MLFQISKAVDRKVFPNLGHPRLDMITLFSIAYTIPGREPHEGSTPRLTNWLAISCRVTWTRSYTRRLRIVTVLCTQLRQYCAFNHHLVEMLSPWSLSVLMVISLARYPRILLFLFSRRKIHILQNFQ